MLAPPAKHKAKHHRAIWNGGPKRLGFYQLWDRLKSKRSIKRGYITTEEFQSWKSAPTPVKAKKMTQRSQKAKFPMTAADIRATNRV